MEITNRIPMYLVIQERAAREAWRDDAPRLFLAPPPMPEDPPAPPDPSPSYDIDADVGASFLV